jgi:gluconolactonase
VTAVVADLRLPASLRTIAEGLDHPEDVCWDPGAGVLLAGGEDGQLYRFDLAGGDGEVVTRIAGGWLTGLCVDNGGNAYCCDVNHGCVQRITQDGRVERYGEPIAYPNSPAFGADGTLWVSDSGDWERPTGRVVAIRPGGQTEVADMDPLSFANGVAVHDGWLYIVESARPGVVRFRLAGGDVEPVVALPNAVPDGLAFDADGGLWISCWQPNRIYRLDPAGQLATVVDDWSGTEVVTPTNVAFAGERLDVLVMASLGGRAVRAFDPGVAGAPLHRPEVTS